MIEKKLSTADLEKVYDQIADAIDRAGPDKVELFLAKLSVALANLVGDTTQVTAAVEASLRDL
jgi:hypothetical protein